MKNMIRGIVVVAALAGTLSANAQTANEIIARYLTAIGGKEAISQVKSISIDSTVQVMGNDAPSTTVILDGVGYKTETDINGSKIVHCYNAKGGWTVNPMAGTSDPTPMPEAEYNAGKDQMYVGGGLYDYASKGSKIEALGKDAATYKIKLTTKENVETVYAIDAATYLVQSVTQKGKLQDQDVDIVTTFSDYRKTDSGLLFPFSMNVDLGGQLALNITVKKVEVNKTVDPATFTMPKAGS
jgi:hypothetical protein